MKTSLSFFSVVMMISIMACNKTANTASQISLTASAPQATIGQTVAVTLSANANVSSWTVSPVTATKTYALTTSKTNYFTFKQAGVYTISVSAKTLAYDSTTQSLANVWNSAKSKSCTQGVDSTSVQISVVK